MLTHDTCSWQRPDGRSAWPCVIPWKCNCSGRSALIDLCWRKLARSELKPVRVRWGQGRSTGEPERAWISASLHHSMRRYYPGQRHSPADVGARLLSVNSISVLERKRLCTETARFQRTSAALETYAYACRAWASTWICQSQSCREELTWSSRKETDPSCNLHLIAVQVSTSVNIINYNYN